MDCCKEKQTKSHSTSTTSKISMIVLCLGGLIIVIMIVKIMKIQIGPLLPYAIFLLCPLLHVFMMKGHGDHGKDHKPS